MGGSSSTTRGRNVAVATISLALAATLAGAGAAQARTPGVSAGANSAVAPAVTGSETTTSNPTALWPTYHRTLDRIGYYPGMPAPRTMSLAWSARLDGQVYAQPLIVGGLLIVATERDYVYAFSMSTHALVWRDVLGAPQSSASLPCGNITPSVGITGTPAYDQATGSLFVAAETSGSYHTLWALDVRTGHVRWHRALDLASRPRNVEQQRGALAVANGKVYVPFGGRAGDCGNYVGYVASYPTGGAGSMSAYVVPTAREGGIWAPPGPAVGSDGSVYVAVGNGAATSGSWDGSDSVLRLSPWLGRLAWFHPASWAAENASDLDLGSSGPLILPGSRVLQSGKRGDIYLLTTSSYLGMRTPLARATGCAAYGGSAYDPSTGVHAAFLPCANGLQRRNIGSTTVSGPVWTAPDSGSPTLAGGFVWYQSFGTLSVRSESTGALHWSRYYLGPTSRFATPVVVPGWCIVGTMAGVTVLRLA